MKATAARQGSLREHNLGLVLRQVLDAAATGATPPSRADVAAATGLTRATVSSLVDRLVAGGLVAELDPVPTQRAGRPAVPLTAAAGTLAALGAEVNVDYLGVRVLDLSRGVLVEHVEHGDFRGSDPTDVLTRLGALVDAAADRLATGRGGVADDRRTPASDTADADRLATAPGATDGGAGTPVAPSVGVPGDDVPGPVRLAGVGLALPGLVDARGGALRYAPNLGWRDVDVATLAAAASRTFATHPPRLANEADLAARAEADVRREPGVRPSFVYVSGEIGVGGALVLDGDLFSGRHGWAGELGHTLVGDGRTLEQVAGQDALLRAAGLDPHDGLDALVAAAAAGAPGVRDALAAAGAVLGAALANVVNLVDVGHVVLGGTYASLADHVRGPVLAALHRHVIGAPWAEPTVDVARAGDHAAMTGAALTVLRRVVADPSAWLVDGTDPA
ncbi:ROK family protein [Cellulomonas fimi]|uniref:ROK family protein n=1 Tax=Cellulomonas fimi TaxID=1708 RepID=UPI00234C24C1|nr:ROK family protein [Cellulomonas fimi]MDC7121423.1 ROK family protein [Cellulomonas fimi]